jgi:hypothetical protein
VSTHIDIGVDGARATLRNWRQDIVDEGKDIIVAEDEAAALPGGLWEKVIVGLFWGLGDRCSRLSVIRWGSLTLTLWTRRIWCLTL